MRSRSQTRNASRNRSPLTSVNKKATKLPLILTAQDESPAATMPQISGLLIGVCSQQGKRPYQEDEFAIRQFLNQQVPGVINDSESETHFFGLFDGHAGGKCSKHLAASLSSVLAEDSLFSTNLPQAIRRSFHATNEQFLKTAEKMKLHDGSTGICALIRDNKLTVANVGDCRALIICGGKALQMSVDQKPTNPDEQKRISALGGAVIYCMGVARVNRVLAVSRAFGNRTLKNVIRPDAELMEKVLTKDDDFLVMASDGLWDVLRNKDVCDICYGTQSSQNNNNRNPQMIADELVHNALFRGSMDNVTCIVVRLNDYVSRCASKVHNNNASNSNLYVPKLDKNILDTNISNIESIRESTSRSNGNMDQHSSRYNRNEYSGHNNNYNSDHRIGLSTAPTNVNNAYTESLNSIHSNMNNNHFQQHQNANLSNINNNFHNNYSNNNNNHINTNNSMLNNMLTKQLSLGNIHSEGNNNSSKENNLNYTIMSMNDPIMSNNNNFNSTTSMLKKIISNSHNNSNINSNSNFSNFHKNNNTASNNNIYNRSNMNINNYNYTNNNNNINNTNNDIDNNNNNNNESNNKNNSLLKSNSSSVLPVFNNASDNNTNKSHSLHLPHNSNALNSNVLNAKMYEELRRNSVESNTEMLEIMKQSSEESRKGLNQNVVNNSNNEFHSFKNTDNESKNYNNLADKNNNNNNDISKKINNNVNRPMSSSNNNTNFVLRNLASSMPNGLVSFLNNSSNINNANEKNSFLLNNSKLLPRSSLEQSFVENNQKLNSVSLQKNTQNNVLDNNNNQNDVKKTKTPIGWTGDF